MRFLPLPVVLFLVQACCARSAAWRSTRGPHGASSTGSAARSARLGSKPWATTGGVAVRGAAPGILGPSAT